MSAPSSDREGFVRVAFAAFNRGEVDALRTYVHDDIEIVPADGYGHPGAVYHGLAGLKTIVSELRSRVSNMQARVKEVRNLGDRLVLLVRVEGEPADGHAGLVGDRAAVLFVDHGRVRRALGFVSEAEALEAAENPTPEEFRAAFENAPSPIVLVDDEGCFREVNAAAASFYGQVREHLRGRQFEDFVPPSRLARFEQLWSQLVAGAGLATEFVLVDSRGTARSVELRGKANYMPGRHLLSFSLRGRAPGALPGPPMLTPREREIFQLLALGFTGREVAAQLVVSPDTVRTHVQNGIGRLGAKTRGQAIALALTRGEISL